MNGAYGVGPLAFERVGELLIKGGWILACLVVFLILIKLLRSWRRL
ncbi:hypothetical protein ABIB96_001250 [Bradyrhizobium sp. LA3.X]